MRGEYKAPSIRDKVDPFGEGCVIYRLEGGLLLLVPEGTKVGIINPNPQTTTAGQPETAVAFAARMRELADAVDGANKQLTAVIVPAPAGMKV